jgi:hypothetical protein
VRYHLTTNVVAGVTVALKKEEQSALRAASDFVLRTCRMQLFASQSR